MPTVKQETAISQTISCFYNTKLCSNSTDMKYCSGCKSFMCQWHLNNHTHFIVCSYKGCNRIVNEYGDPKKVYYNIRCSAHGSRSIQYDSYGKMLYDGR